MAGLLLCHGRLAGLCQQLFRPAGAPTLQPAASRCAAAGRAARCRGPPSMGAPGGGILAVQNRLSALLLEMVDQGHDTRGLPRNAKEAQVKQALQWNDAGWPWNDYAPAIMAAVEAGVPVLGANLPSERQRPAMRDLSLDMRLLQPALERQRAAIRDSHCGLLDEAQVAPMTRIQIARDLAMAQAVMKAPRPPGRTVLLLAGADHVLRPVGIPAHLP